MTKKTRRVDIYLILILLLALFLYGWNTWNAGTANTYYTAAIKSMTMSWHNFWYGSFDPAGFITVDKPPVALWFMAISAKIFGLHGWSIVLPSVLFGVGSVYLIYKMIAPKFGVIPGRLAALVMVLTPIAVADSRTNNMDATLIFFLLLAGWFLQKSVDKAKLRYLFISFALIGIAFNVKMLQAYMVVPAMLLYYWIASKKRWPKRAGWLMVAMAFLAVFTLIWPVSVDSTSASKRPYIGSSQTNSVMELAFGYNGTQRLLGQSTGTGGRFPGMGNNKTTKTTKNKTGANQGMPGGTGKAPTGAPGGQNGGKMPTGAGGKGPTGMQGRNRGMGGGGGAFDIGTAGVTRLFQTSLGRQISWLLPFAIIGFISAFAYYIDRKKRWYQLTQQQKELLYWIGWGVPVFAFFSVASFFHPYYTIMLAPPIAALVGIGAYTGFKQFKTLSLKNWQTYLLPLAFLTTLALQAYYVATYYLWLTWLLAVAGVLLTILAFGFKAKKQLKPIGITGLVALLLAPGWWSLTPTLASESAQIPTAGPDLLSQSGGGMGRGGMDGQGLSTKTLNYLLKHQGNAKYLFAAPDTSTAASVIIKTGKAVMAIGGFNGTDPSLTLKQFKALVAKGDVKYYLSSGKGSSTAITKWVEKYGKKLNISGSSSTTTAKTTNSKTTGNNPGTTTPQQPTAGGPNGATAGNKTGRPTMPNNATAKTRGTARQGEFGGFNGGGFGGQSQTIYDLTGAIKKSQQ